MQSLASRLFYHLVKRRLARSRAQHIPLPEARRLRDAQAVAFTRMPPGVRSEDARIAGLRAQWLRPVGERAAGVVLYLHGGAYCMGSILTHRGLAARLAMAAQAPSLLLEYRLAPEAPFPAAVDDAFAAWTALTKAHPGTPVALVGDSAGGGLALALALRIRQEAAGRPAAIALLSPWTDLTLGNQTHRTKAAVDPFFPDSTVLGSAARAYAQGHPLTDPLISPQFADLGGLPPTLIHVGEREVLLDDARVLARRMQAAATPAELVVYPRMWHVWQAFGGRFREADRSIEELGRFIGRHLTR